MFAFTLLGIVVFALVTLVGIALLAMELTSRLSRYDPQREVREHRERLLNPRWDEVEAKLGRPVPAALRELYEDRELIASQSLYFVEPLEGNRARLWNITDFVPAGPEAVAWSGEWHTLPPETFTFATTLFEHAYYVVPDGTDESGPVFMRERDGVDQKVAPSLRVFLGWPIAK